MVARWGWLSTLALIVGCAQGTTQGFDAFGDGASTPTTSSATGDDEDSGDDDEDTGVESIDTGISESATADGSDTSASSTASGGSDESTTNQVSGGTTSGTTADGGESSSSGGDDDGTTTGNPGSGQPGMGIWAHCTEMDDTNCVAPSGGCVFTDNNDGFCTALCTNPAADCGPTIPGITAAAICFPINDVNMNPINLCGLDCSGGRTCPTGMACTNLNVEGHPMQMLCV